VEGRGSALCRERERERGRRDDDELMKERVGFRVMVFFVLCGVRIKV
jgi:hypothetical protein